MTAISNKLPANGEVYYFPGFFAPADADRFFSDLRKDTPWKQEPIRIFGKEVMQPRLTALYGSAEKTYGYSGIVMQALPWTGALQEIREVVEPAVDAVFDIALLNLYRDGKDSMGWHRDNEKELGPEPLIASLSFGVTRRFLLRPYRLQGETLSFDLEHGSLLIMKGASQRCWEHSLPKTNRDIGPRINITFRALK